MRNGRRNHQSSNAPRSAFVSTALPRAKKTAEPSRTPPSLLEHYYARTKVIRTATASERPSAGPGRARGESLRASLCGLLASTRPRLTMNLATNQRAQGRDRTNVCMCHLDHLLQLPWAHRRRVPPTEAARPKLILEKTLTAARINRRRAICPRLAASVRSTRTSSCACRKPLRRSQRREAYTVGVPCRYCPQAQRAQPVCDVAPSPPWPSTRNFGLQASAPWPDARHATANQLSRRTT